MKTQEAKQIPLVEILEKLGYNPKKTKGNEVWFLSPFRKENTPSFKVDTKLNLWYDHGSKQGGSTIDLIMNIKNYTIQEALNELSSFTGYNTHSQTQTTFKNENKSILETQEDKNDISIIQQTKTIQNEALIEYLQSRKINIQIAKSYLQEIRYKVNEKTYFALGFKNDSGGFELRNKFFKGSLKGSPKDITSIIQEENQDKTLLIFEGFIDFLSLFTVKNFLKKEDLKDDVIVLNSLSMLDKTIKFIQENKESYSQINLYLDNDPAGKQAVNKIMFSLDNIKINDISQDYKDCKDLNELLNFI